MKNKRDIEWLYPHYDFFWSFTHSMVSFGDIDNAYDYEGAYYNGETKGIYSIFDSGSSTINIPAQYFASFIENIFYQMDEGEYSVVEGFVITECYEDFPELFF